MARQIKDGHANLSQLQEDIRKDMSDIPPPTDGNNNNNGNGKDNNNTRNCKRCERKDPPVITPLEVGVNITERRWQDSKYYCNDCEKESQAYYRSRAKEQYCEYLQALHDQTVDTFREQWNDPAYAKIKELADRVYKVFDKYDRREPKAGIRRDWGCEVVFEDLWFADPTMMLNAYFQRRHAKQSERMAKTAAIMEFICDPEIAPMLLEGHRTQAKNRWASMVDAFHRKFANIDKLVASPAYQDPVLKEFVDNWYLLSKRQELEQRSLSRKALKDRLDIIEKQEELIIDTREKIEQRQEQENKDDKTPDSDKENGSSESK